MLYPSEPRINDIIKRWNHAEELYEGLREEAEQAIRQYDEMERMYEDTSYFLHEAEDRIAELEEEVRLLRASGEQNALSLAKPYDEDGCTQEEK